MVVLIYITGKVLFQVPLRDVGRPERILIRQALVSLCTSTVYIFLSRIIILLAEATGRRMT